MRHVYLFILFFFFIAPPTPKIYTLSLHDALPISIGQNDRRRSEARIGRGQPAHDRARIVTALVLVVRRQRDAVRREVLTDRKSTRLNSSHRCISYAVFCLKKKKQKIHTNT